MADKKDKTPSEENAESELTTSNSLEKPLLDEKPPKETADIDTSYLTLDETPGQSNDTLETVQDLETPAIDTSHLSLEEDDKTKPSNHSTEDLSQDNNKTAERPPSDEPQADTSADKPEPAEKLLFVKNPLAKKTTEPSVDLPSEKEAQAPAMKDETEQVMLATGVSDAEFDKEIQADTAGRVSSKNPKADEDRHSEGPIKSILETVKKPESIVRKAWSDSSTRRYLIDNVESFRAKDEDQNMESVIENVYGGAIEKKIAPGKFLKENLLFSFLLLLFLFLVGWKVAGIFFPEFMPTLNDQIIETVQKTTNKKSVAKSTKKKKLIATNVANKEKIDAVLSHCLIEPDARIVFTRNFARVGYEFSKRPLTLSYEEVKYSIHSWENMNMEFYIRDTVFRFRELARLALPIMQKANKIVSDYNQSLSRIKEQVNTLEYRIRNIQTRGGNQTTNTINERIPLLSKLDEINARLVDEPDQKRFDKLLKKMLLVENILSGREKPKRIEPDQLTEDDPEWLVSTAETPSSDIATPIIGKVLPTIEIPADKLRKVFPKLTAFHLSELENALDDLLKLTALIVYLPENKLIPYKLELSGLNRRLNKVMKKELPAWMNFDRCLAKGRAEVSAASE